MLFPAPSLLCLLATASPDAASLLHSLPMAPCLALVARYPRRELAWSGIQAPSEQVVSWIGHDTSKRPELHPNATVLVIHASAEFSSDHFDAGEKSIARRLLECGGHIAQSDLSAPQSLMLQRWRYALGAELGGEFARVIPGPQPLVLAGDRVTGRRIAPA